MCFIYAALILCNLSYTSLSFQLLSGVIMISGHSDISICTYVYLPSEKVVLLEKD